MNVPVELYRVMGGRTELGALLDRAVTMVCGWVDAEVSMCSNPAAAEATSGWSGAALVDRVFTALVEAEGYDPDEIEEICRDWNDGRIRDGLAELERRVKQARRGMLGAGKEP